MVAALDQNPEKLVAISMKEVTPKEAKAVYYNHKLLQTLFPYNFPKIFAAWGKEDGKGISANFRERVDGRSMTKRETELIQLHQNVSSEEFPFHIVREALAEMNIPIVFDKNERNYMVSDYGDEIFVDTINFNGWTAEHKRNIIAFMETNSYSDIDIKIVNMCLDRLLILNAPNQTVKH